MNLTLHPDDRRVIDLLLDRSHAAAASDAQGNGKAQTLFAAADPSLAQRLARAQMLLRLLDELGAVDPAPDLLARTLRRVEQAKRGHPPARPQLPQVNAGQRPVA